MTWIKYFDKNWIVALTIGIYGRTLLLLAALRFRTADQVYACGDGAGREDGGNCFSARSRLRHLDDLFLRLKAAVVERQRAPDRDRPRASVE